MGDGVFKKRRTCDKPHYENEEPFDIPSSWVWTTINDINMYNSKNVDPAKHKENIFELYSVPVFPTDTPEIVKGEKIGSAKQSVENGDVLLRKINPKINRVWFVKNRTENAMIASSEWIVVRNKFMLTDYLVFCFMSPYFRDLIDSGLVSDEELVKLFKMMIVMNVDSAKELTIDQIQKCIANPIVCNKLSSGLMKFYFDPKLIYELIDWNDATVVGGLRKQCLSEIFLYLKGLDIKYKENNQYIYG